VQFKAIDPSIYDSFIELEEMQSDDEGFELSPL
jgi:hypothetical protein